ncbi:unnamed protein product [Pleuronectes platessa]|uniref:Uncharacterized protein n=1 Tax=Pleuronectes platessa TaxID=8262 RepID=A0A9N7YFL7_PLEPL|nr:unnamed protein product [Pleuronectes platessa]
MRRYDSSARFERVEAEEEEGRLLCRRKKGESEAGAREGGTDLQSTQDLNSLLSSSSSSRLSSRLSSSGGGGGGVGSSTGLQWAVLTRCTRSRSLSELQRGGTKRIQKLTCEQEARVVLLVDYRGFSVLPLEPLCGFTPTCRLSLRLHAVSQGRQLLETSDQCRLGGVHTHIAAGAGAQRRQASVDSPGDRHIHQHQPGNNMEFKGCG